MGDDRPSIVFWVLFVLISSANIAVIIMAVVR
jgi:hypothetical protein